MARIALNGLGRIGKLLLRRLFDEGLADQIVLLNEPGGDLAQHGLLLEFDTVHGRWGGDIQTDGDHLTVNGHAMRFTRTRAIEDMPLGEVGIDLVLDCTGVFKSVKTVAPIMQPE